MFSMTRSKFLPLRPTICHVPSMRLHASSDNVVRSLMAYMDNRGKCRRKSDNRMRNALFTERMGLELGKKTTTELLNGEGLAPLCPNIHAQYMYLG